MTGFLILNGHEPRVYEPRQMRWELSKYVQPPVPGTDIIFGLRINSLDQDDVIKNQIVWEDENDRHPHSLNYCKTFSYLQFL